MFIRPLNEESLRLKSGRASIIKKKENWMCFPAPQRRGLTPMRRGSSKLGLVIGGGLLEAFIRPLNEEGVS